MKFHTLAKIPTSDQTEEDQKDMFEAETRTSLLKVSEDPVKLGLLQAVFHLLGIIRTLDEKAYPYLVETPVEYML